MKFQVYAGNRLRLTTSFTFSYSPVFDMFPYAFDMFSCIMFNFHWIPTRCQWVLRSATSATATLKLKIVDAVKGQHPVYVEGK